MVRKILGTLAGVVIAMLVVMLMDGLGHTLFPESAAKSMAMADIAAALAAAPFAALAIQASGWFLAPLIGGVVAVKLSRWSPSGLIVAGLILAACAYNGFTIPGVPLWMQIAGIVLPLLAGFIVSRVARPA